MASSPSSDTIAEADLTDLSMGLGDDYATTMSDIGVIRLMHAPTTMLPPPMVWWGTSWMPPRRHQSEKTFNRSQALLNRSYCRWITDIKNATADIDSVLFAPIADLEERVRTSLAKTSRDLGLSNSYQGSWNALASLQMLYPHAQDSHVLEKVFVDLTTRESGDMNLEFLVFTLSEMIKGEFSYLAAAPEDFCTEEVVTALLRAQFRAREMLLFVGLVTEDGGTERLRSSFAREQEEQYRFIMSTCGNGTGGSEHLIKKVEDSTVVDQSPRPKRKVLRYFFNLSVLYFGGFEANDANATNRTVIESCR